LTAVDAAALRQAATEGMVDPGTTLMRLFGSVRDHAIDASEETVETPYRAFLDALAVAVYTTDADGRITFFNEAAVDLWGRRPELGEEWCGSLHLFHLDGRPMRHDECPMAVALKEQRPVRGELAMLERPDGRRVAFTPFPTPLRDPDGTMIGAVNVMVDVTDRLTAEHSLRTTAEALQASNSVKDEFLGLISHELRTPVTTIYAGSKVLARGNTKLDEEVRRSVFEDIHMEAERLHRLVEDVIALTRFGEEEAEIGDEPVLLQRLLPSVVRSEEVRWPGVSFRLRVGSGLPTVVADATYVEQVVRNLLSNAAKYGGPESHVDAVVEAAGAEVLVRILDDGPGFPPGEADRLFDLYYRSPSTAGVASGAGIGLFVCARLIRAMGGRIWATSRPDGGAEFGFSLRVMAED
jgi:PAS domain S-box-containing protein